MEQFYVYAYLRSDGSPYYIGKGKGRRRFDPRGKAAKPPTNKGLIVLLKEGLSEQMAFWWEMVYIRHWGRKDQGGILRNKSDGGEGAAGAVRSEAFKEGISRLHKGRKRSAVTKAKISAAQVGRAPIPVSAEGRARQAESQRGKPKSEAAKAKMRGPRGPQPKVKAAQQARGAARRAEVKPKVIEMLLAGATQRAIYAELRVSPNLISEWRAELREQGAPVRPARGWNKAPEDAPRFACGRLKKPMQAA
jgi:hypothetical protein